MARFVADRYELVARLGAGGGGVVWRAHDTELDRTVAVKEIELGRGLPDDERERVQTRALREARAAARLEHTHVVSVYDVRSDDEAIHIIMEYVEAPSLQHVVDDSGPLAPERAARLGLEVLDALQAAHDAGIVHRDVKPSNVLVAARGAVVTDFGIAAVTGDTALTMSGQALGTPDYVSPEQVSGDDIGPATDLWSLGATLYLAVEGAPPFRRERSLSTVHAVVHDPPRPMARAGALAPVLHALLTKDPRDRPTMADARTQLQHIIDHTGQDATRAIPPAAFGETTEMAAAPAAAAEPTRRQEPVTPTQRQPSAPAPPPPEPTGTPPADPEQAARRRRRTAWAAAAAVAALVILAVVLATLPDDTDPADAPVAGTEAPTAEASDPADPDPTDVPTEAPTTETPTTDPAEASPSPSPTASPSPTVDDDVSQGTVPDGWEVYEGPNFSVAHPPSWTTRDGPGSAVDLVAPSSGDYLRVANTDDPADDVLADTERIAQAFAQEHDGYQQLRLEPVDYRDTEAAIWEYTFTDGGQQLHGVHLNLSTGEYGYALNHVAAEADWDDAAERFDRFTASFSYPN